jgi:hypothetical protein
MPGNAWYGFSNEVLDILLRKFGSEAFRKHPSCLLPIVYGVMKEWGIVWAVSVI